MNVFADLGGRIVYHDSRGRYWLGLNGNGLGMYDPVTQKTFQYATGNKDLQITGDIVVDITEDKNGIIWVSTLSGINGIDTEKGEIHRFTSREGLLSNSTSALRVDSLNRLWIATARGINVFDSSRTSFTRFGIHDGFTCRRISGTCWLYRRQWRFYLSICERFCTVQPHAIQTRNTTPFSLFIGRKCF
ncbi:MAG: hypothetical protein NVV59_08770 [Chitinophagaceae bacterium]|nr:hypothetical protein [Chitinophagaceae bacterium]